MINKHKTILRVNKITKLQLQILYKIAMSIFNINKYLLTLVCS